MGNILVPIDTGRKAPYMVEITEHETPIGGLPESLAGFTFVHLTDLHGGYGNTDPVYEEAISRVNALKPDLLLFTGDYIDDHGENDYPMTALLRRFEARYGSYGSFGNHDHRRGVVGTQRILEQAGVQVLNNANAQVAPGLWVAGVDDYYEGEPDLPRALAGIPDESTAILLSHNPNVLKLARNYNVLMLSGHTHGGQIALPVLTPRIVVGIHLRCAQVAGWYRNGRARLYVNRGLGVTGKPFRYRCPAEIAIFRLVPDPNRPAAQDVSQERVHQTVEMV